MAEGLVDVPCGDRAAGIGDCESGAERVSQIEIRGIASQRFIDGQRAQECRRGFERVCLRDVVVVVEKVCFDFTRTALYTPALCIISPAKAAGRLRQAGEAIS